MKVYAGNEFADKWFSDEVPFPLRVLCNSFWIDAHMNDIYRYILAIEKNTPIVEDGGCLIQ